MMTDLIIRLLTFADVPRLWEIDAEFESDHFLDVEKTTKGLEVTWRLVERELVPPFRSSNYSLSRQQREEVGMRLREGDGLYLVAEDASSRKLVALLDVERERWRDTATVWNILVDRAYRRRGLGSELMKCAIAWARSQKLRGIMLETQTNNFAASRFYQAMGFCLCGIDDHFYSNDDIAVKEVAIFWWYELDFPPSSSDARGAEGEGDSPFPVVRRGKGLGDGG